MRSPRSFPRPSPNVPQYGSLECPKWTTFLKRCFPDIWTGKYFLFFSFVFLFSCTILSLRLESIWFWGLGISAIFLVSGIAGKNALLYSAAIFPLVAALLLQTNLDSIAEWQEETAAYVREHPTLTGIVMDIGNVRKWQRKATLQLSNQRKVSVVIPAQHSILPSRELSFENAAFQTGSFFQSSRGIMGEIRYSGFELGEIREWPYLIGWKNSIIERIRAMFPFPESALLTGILVGDDSLMDEDFSTLYRKIGLSHITVVSGSNIAAIMAVFCILFKKLSTFARMVICLLWTWCYVMLVGTDPPVLRALVMGSVSMVALTYGERADSFRILVFTAVFLVAFSPLSLVYDAGFQLSFLATVGILVSVRLLKNRSVAERAAGVSIFAGIWTLPISIGSFGTFHTWSIPANILVGPAVEFSMFWWALAVLADWIYRPLGYAVGYVSYFTLWWIRKVAEVLSELPLQIQFDPRFQGMFAFLVFGITTWFSLRYLYLPDPSVGSSAPSDPRWISRTTAKHPSARSATKGKTAKGTDAGIGR